MQRRLTTMWVCSNGVSKFKGQTKSRSFGSLSQRNSSAQTWRIRRACQLSRFHNTSTSNRWLRLIRWGEGSNVLTTLSRPSTRGHKRTRLVGARMNQLYPMMITFSVRAASRRRSSQRRQGTKKKCKEQSAKRILRQQQDRDSPWERRWDRVQHQVERVRASHRRWGDKGWGSRVYG